MSIISRTGVAVLRGLASHCLIPRLRHYLYRTSGLALGEGAFVNMGVAILDDYKNLVTIGQRVAIAPNVILVAVSDPNNSWLRTIGPLSKTGPVVLGDDCWIGAGAIILPGVVIGERAIVAAGAVVTRNVGAGEVHAGVPAKKIGHIEDYM